MNTLNTIIDQLKAEKEKRVLSVGSKRATDIKETFDICINIILDNGVLFEKEKLEYSKIKCQKRVSEYDQLYKKSIQNIINQLENL